MRHAITAALLLAAVGFYALGYGGIGQAFLWLGFICEFAFWVRLANERQRREEARSSRAEPSRRSAT